MKRNVHLLCVIFLTFLLFSCQYELSEDFYNDIELEAPTASLALLNFNSEGVFKKNTEVNFNYLGDNKHRLFQIQIFIDDNLEVNTNSESGSFTIDAMNLSEGNHSLKVEYYFSSGTESLADLNNLETYSVIEEFNFTVDKSIAEAFMITDVKIEDGTINVYWEDVVDFNFNEAYLIIKENGYTRDEVLLTEEVIIQKRYNDSISIDGQLSYQIKVENDFATSESDLKELEEINSLEINYDIIGVNRFKFTWGQHPLYSNFDDLIFSGNYLNNNQEIELDKNGGELIIDSENNPEFEELYYCGFELHKNNNRISGFGFSLDWGKKFEKSGCNEYIFDQNTNSYYALELVGESSYNSPREVYIHQLDPDDLSLIRSSYITTVYNANGDLTLDPNTGNLIVDTSLSSLIVDISDLSVAKHYNSADYTDKTNSFYTKYRNGLILIIDGASSGSSYFYNAETRELIHTGLSIFFKVSDAGKYFFSDNDMIYKIDNQVISKLTEIEDHGSKVALFFIENEEKCIYSSTYSNPILHDLEKGTQTVLFNNDGRISNITYDYVTKKVLFQIYEEVNILDLDTNELHTINYDSDNNHRGNYQLKILNNKLISSNGYYLDYFEQ